MPITTTRRHMLAGSAATLALPAFARAQSAVKPRLTVISQWSAGSDGAAITALGKKFEEKGGIWQHSPVPGFTTEMMNKLRAEIMAGDPPACSQLKGPEIAAWSKIAPTVDLDALVVLPPAMKRLSLQTLHDYISREASGSHCRCRSTARTCCFSPNARWIKPKPTRSPPHGPTSTTLPKR